MGRTLDIFLAVLCTVLSLYYLFGKGDTQTSLLFMVLARTVANAVDINDIKHLFFAETKDTVEETNNSNTNG